MFPSLRKLAAILVATLLAGTANLALAQRLPCGDPCNPPIYGVDCRMGDGCGEPHWKAWGPIPWQAFAQGEYVGPARLSHVPEYHLRVDDEIEFIYRLTREELAHPYLL
ncbi:MAG TPA: hypothetical protein VFV87_04495, partial [Pirellulaceae bacterium]|nr:hypothetical protein [Pirellulaceae bacterium]